MFSQGWRYYKLATDQYQNSVSWQGGSEETLEWLESWRESASGDWWVKRKLIETCEVDGVLNLVINVRANVFHQMRRTLVNAMEEAETREVRAVYEGQITDVRDKWNDIYDNLTSDKE